MAAFVVAGLLLGIALLLLVSGCASGEDVLSGGGEPTLRNEHGQPMQLGSTRGLTVAEADWSGFVADWSRREPLSAVTLAPTSIGRLSDGKRTTWSVAARSMTRLLIRLRSSRDADPGPGHRSESHGGHDPSSP
jgi:hypothetical protein